MPIVRTTSLLMLRNRGLPELPRRGRVVWRPRNTLAQSLEGVRPCAATWRARAPRTADTAGRAHVPESHRSSCHLPWHTGAETYGIFVTARFADLKGSAQALHDSISSEEEFLRSALYEPLVEAALLDLHAQVETAAERFANVTQ